MYPDQEQSDLGPHYLSMTLCTQIRLLLQEQSDLGPSLFVYEASNILVAEKNPYIL